MIRLGLVVVVAGAVVAAAAYRDHIRDHRTVYARWLTRFTTEWAPGKYRGAP